MNCFFVAVLGLQSDQGEPLRKFPYNPRICTDAAAVEVLENPASLHALLWFKKYKCKHMAA